MYHVAYTQNCRYSYTDFEADSLNEAIELFARVHPNVGDVTILDDVVYRMYLVKDGHASLFAEKQPPQPVKKDWDASEYFTRTE